MPPTPPPPPSPDERTVRKSILQDTTYVNAMSHFYRGELGRIMIWRQRLDVTTTWAITSTSTIFTVAFSLRDVPHIIFFFNLAIVTILMWIEARRYRFYDAFHARVRMLEAHFLVPMVTQRPETLEGDWRKLVAEDLLIPSFKIGPMEAVGWRLKQNYVFIYVLILAAWMVKVFMHSPHPIDSPASFYDALAVGQIASWLVAVVMLGTMVGTIAIVAYVARKLVGEIHEFGRTARSRWRI
ncbi:MAG: DUF2270 domain-containing protein [Verrucomicrobiae bacterium]|nr:DUF2270 domain-containing protein [Verrucomicrobiae bacterium]